MNRKCPICGRLIKSLGIASHRAAHYRRGEMEQKPGPPAVEKRWNDEDVKQLVDAVREYLEWGPMTGSDRDYHASNLKRAVEPFVVEIEAKP